MYSLETWELKPEGPEPRLFLPPLIDLSGPVPAPLCSILLLPQFTHGLSTPPELQLDFVLGLLWC